MISYYGEPQKVIVENDEDNSINSCDSHKNSFSFDF